MKLLQTLLCLFGTALALQFSYTNETFLLNGKPYTIMGGQMDPQRIPHQLWRDRLSKARAMGLNTIFAYTYWDQLEPKQGQWNNEGNNDVARYFRIAKEEGLNIFLRPGPYICGEHEWGGFPAWLNSVPGMEVRTDNGPFLEASRNYLNRLGEDIKDLLVSNGGNVLMSQVENEYGSYGSNHKYISALRDMMFEAFPGIPLYTNDGGTQEMLEGGQIPGALAITDGDPKTGFATQDKYVSEPSSMGPHMDGEYYITWMDQWNSGNNHSSNSGDPAAIKKNQDDITWILKSNGSFAIYMFHGGTNWGFQNGADWSTKLDPITTSYDYSAPLDESGRKTDIYDALRETLREWQGEEGLPPVVEQEPAIEIPEFKVQPSVGLFDTLPDPVKNTFPVIMEELDQGYGFTLYRHVASEDVSGKVQPGDAPRDRVIVYINGKRQGVIDSTYATPGTVNVDMKREDVLDLLVENLGRVNYGPRIPDQRKGIVGNVTVGDNTLQNWEMYPLPLEDTSSAKRHGKAPEPSTDSAPIFYTGSFEAQKPGDTFIELPGWVKGQLWVNGVNLGRYWTIGPQQTLYLPGVYMKEKNEVVVLALEPTGDEEKLRGLKTRNWGNNPDPDYSG